MMTSLHISLENPMLGGIARAAALADVVPIEPKGGTQRRDLVIPVGTHLAVDVEPGRYLVQSVLPSGELVDCDVTVAAGASQKVVLQGNVTPHEWLGWQRFSPERKLPWDSTRKATSTVRASLLFHSKEWLTAAPTPRIPLQPSHSDGLTSAFEVTDLVHWETRAFLVVRRDRRTDTVVVPAPWNRHYPRSTIQIAVPHDANFPISIAIQDEDFGPLLGYVASGALTSARKFLPGDVRYVVQMLAEKYENPFGAAVAGYLLITTSNEKEHWHSWIENLANDFPWIADGAVLSGWLALRNKDPDRARERFQEAVGRGIPVVTGILRMLHQGLLAVDDEISLATVSSALARADIAQPFVTLRFEDDQP